MTVLVIGIRLFIFQVCHNVIQPLCMNFRALSLRCRIKFWGDDLPTEIFTKLESALNHVYYRFGPGSNSEVLCRFSEFI